MFSRNNCYSFFLAGSVATTEKRIPVILNITINKKINEKKKTSFCYKHLKAAEKERPFFWLCKFLATFTS